MVGGDPQHHVKSRKQGKLRLLGRYGLFNDDAHAQKLLALNGENHDVAQNYEEFHHGEEHQNDVSCDEELKGHVLQSHDAQLDDELYHKLALAQ